MSELEPIAEICARQTMLEFVMEIILSNELSNVDSSNSETFKSDLVDRFRSVEVSDGSDQTMAIAMRAAELAENLMRKVSEREVDLRRQRGEEI